MVRSRRARILVGLSILFVVMPTAGKSSKVVMSWKNPAYVHTKVLSRVLALGLSDKARIRADFEDALAAQLAETGLETIPGNTILLRPEGTNLDLQYLRTQVRENKLDAVVVSRLIKVDNTVTYVPGTAYFLLPFPTTAPFTVIRCGISSGLHPGIPKRGKEGAYRDEFLCHLFRGRRTCLDWHHRHLQPFQRGQSDQPAGQTGGEANESDGAL